MRFSISTAYLPLTELPALAVAADRLGYDAMAVPDHVVDLETLETPYPYTRDGARRWDRDASWPDPWVLVGSLAAVTTRLRFFTSVYVPALRNPFQVAKSVGTAAVLSGNRVGDLYTVEEAAGHAATLARMREEAGNEGDFAFITALTDAFLPEQFAAAEERVASPT